MTTCNCLGQGICPACAEAQILQLIDDDDDVLLEEILRQLLDKLADFSFKRGVEKGVTGAHAEMKQGLTRANASGVAARVIEKDLGL